MSWYINFSLFGVSLTLSITNGKLNLGMWQGIYLDEHKDFLKESANTRVLAEI
jgi:thiamine phosphate synthase YjbQ (UPF0047 family)